MFAPRLLTRVGSILMLVCVACSASPSPETAPRGENGTRTGPAEAPEATAQEVATSFVEAYGAFDLERAMTHLAANADIEELIGSVGASGVEGTVEEFRLLLSLLEAEGYKQKLDSCEEQGSSASGTLLRCMFDFHLLRSDEIGRGPFSGSSFLLTVRDGEIVRAVKNFAIGEFSPQMWEPFADWVSMTYPEDSAVMYEDETYGGARLTEESIRLWEKRSREYVKEVGRGTEEEVD